MGPKYNAATSIDKLGSTNMYRRSKRASKKVKMPNLVKTAKFELFVAVKGRERPTIPSVPICPKALHGSQIQCCNKHRQIGEHQHVQEE
jgi:hypothetical protein